MRSSRRPRILHRPDRERRQPAGRRAHPRPPPTAGVDLHEAKTQLSRLIERVEAGEEIIISRAGKPVARLIPLRRHTEARRPGAWRGRVVLHQDFDQLPEEIAGAFDGQAP